MCRSGFIVAAFLCLTISFLTLETRIAQSAEKKVLILKADEVEEGEIASKLYTNIINRISEHLEKAGYQALTSQNYVTEGSDAALLSRIKAQNDAHFVYVALVKVLANTVLEEEGTRIDLEIAGRMLQVSNGAVLARFDLPLPAALRAPAECDRDCIIRLLEDNTAALADSLGTVLAQRLEKSQQ
ncbi:MAG: hypothetical protein ABJN43_19245, partial [Sneathiella sp.]